MLTNTMLKKNRISSAILAATLAATTSLAAHAEDPVGALRVWQDGFGFGPDNGNWRVDKHPRILADVNGDGLDDIVGFANAAVYVSLSTGSQYLTARRWIEDFVIRKGGWDVDKHPRLLADVNGDGMDDIVAFGNGGMRVALSTGGRFEEDFAWHVPEFGVDHRWLDGAKHTRYAADVNGDGRADIVGFGSDELVTAISTISDGVGSFVVDDRWGIPFGDYYYGTYDGFDPVVHQRFVTDVDGDGRADIVAIKDDTRIHLSSATGIAQRPSLVIDDFGFYDGYDDNNRYPRYIADMDGNGVKDIVGFAYEQIHVTLLEKVDPACTEACAIKVSGSQFNDASESFVQTSGGWQSLRHPRFVEDVNGDGRADVLGFADNGVWVSYSEDTGDDGLGDRLTPPVRTVSNYGFSKGGWRTEKHVRTLADVDGNGRPDIVGFGHVGVFVSRFNTFAPEDCVLQASEFFDPDANPDHAKAFRSLCVFD